MCVQRIDCVCAAPWTKIGCKIHRPKFQNRISDFSVWTVFSMHGRTPNVCTVGGFNQRMCQAIIDKQILAFLYKVHRGPAPFSLQQDNCGLHRVKSTADYFANGEITRMHWHPQIPNCNCIENVWCLFKHSFRKQNMHSRNPMHTFTILSMLISVLAIQEVGSTVCYISR